MSRYAIIAGVVFAVILGTRPASLALPDARSADLWVNYLEGGDIDAFDMVTHKLVRTVTKDVSDTDGVCFSPDGTRVYLGSESGEPGKQLLYVVDTASGKTIKTVPLDGRARGSMSISNDGKLVFIPWQQLNEKLPAGLDVVDTTTLEKVSIPTSSGLHDTFITPDGRYVYAGGTDGNLTVVDAAAEKTAWELKFPTGLLTMTAEAGPDGATSRLFIMRNWLDGFEVVDFAKRQVVDTVTFPETAYFKADLHVRGPNGQAHGATISPDGKTLWANTRRGDAVFVYSLPDLKLLGQATFGDSCHAPGWIIFSPDGGTVFDECESDPKVKVLNAQTIKVIDTINLNNTPRRIYLGPKVLP